MTPASRAALRNAVDMLQDACAHASPDWLYSTPRGKILRKARRAIERLLEDQVCEELDAESDLEDDNAAQ
mgnify:CR=1 FL=1